METTTRTLNSMLQVVDSVENDALEYARRAGFQGTNLEKIGLAVREIVNNAIIHGNRLDGQKKVIVRIARTTNQITITVWDQGRLRSGFAPRSSFAGGALEKIGSRDLFRSRVHG